jgi:Sec-independent protein translocase protein TatA
MGSATEILFLVMLGLVILGPKQLHMLLGHVARSKAKFEDARRGFASLLGAELDAAPQDGKTDFSHKSSGNS